MLLELFDHLLPHAQLGQRVHLELLRREGEDGPLARLRSLARQIEHVLAALVVGLHPPLLAALAVLGHGIGELLEHGQHHIARFTVAGGGVEEDAVAGPGHYVP